MLVVAGVAIGVAGALFSGGETAARDPVGAETADSSTSGAAPVPVPSADGAAEAGVVPGDDPAGEAAGVVPEAATPATSSVAEQTVDTVTADASELPAGTGTDPAAGLADANSAVAPGDEAQFGAAGGGTEGEDSAAVGTGTAGGGGGTGVSPTTEANVSPAGAVTVDEPAAEGAATDLIERLRPLVATADPNVPAYDRDHFAGWLDSDGDCVNTRHETLQVEAVGYSMNASGCAVASGEWFDPYTNRTYTDPRDLDVDHVVALADAWVSGAWAWADELLDRFSNDLGNLNAIAAGENRSKSAQGPATYSPTAPGARCEYLVQYVTVKIRWELSITPEDFEAVADGLADCDVGIVPETPTAAPTAPSSPPAAPAPATAPAPSAPATAPSPAASTPTSPKPVSDCHPAYDPCLPNLPGDALNCGDLSREQKPVTVLRPSTDPYRLDRDGDGRGCTS